MPSESGRFEGYLRCGRTWQCHLMYLPSGDRHGMLIGRIAAPHGLYERRRRLATPYHMLLSLLLLHLQRKAASQNALQMRVCVCMNDQCFSRSTGGLRQLLPLPVHRMPQLTSHLPQAEQRRICPIGHSRRQSICPAR